MRQNCTVHTPYQKVGSVTLVHDEVKDGSIIYNKDIVYNTYLRPPQARTPHVNQS